MRKALFPLAVSVAALAAYLPFTVVHDPRSPEVCDVVAGVVVRISSPCCEDLEIRLRGDARRYHVNRGLGLQELRSTVGRPVRLWIAPSRWTPLDPFGERAPVAQMVVEGDVVWTVF